MENLPIQEDSKLYFELDIDELLQPYGYTTGGATSNAFRNTYFEIALFGKKSSIKRDYEERFLFEFTPWYLWNWDDKKVGIFVDLRTSKVIVCERTKDTTYLIGIEDSESTNNYIVFIANTDRFYNDFQGFLITNEMIINAIKISLVEN